MKIAIIGNPGSGKSTCARNIHKILNVPLYHLDRHYWKPGWQRPNREEFARIHHELCDRENLIIEGLATRHFEYRAQKADIIIFLDIPLATCIYRILKRAFLNYGKEGFASPAGCPERLPDREFMHYVWTFNRVHQPVVLSLLATYKSTKKIFIIQDESAVQQIISTMKSI
jgi:adenylate kinase family enzyme